MSRFKLSVQRVRIQFQDLIAHAERFVKLFLLATAASQPQLHGRAVSFSRQTTTVDFVIRIGGFGIVASRSGGIAGNALTKAKVRFTDPQQ